jgi:signal transduction histidine kinase
VTFTQRIPVTGPRDDMGELVETINSMLARLERAFIAQQRFAANASHELRGPITTLRALVEVAAADPDASSDLRDLAGQLAEQFHRQQQVVDGLLALASSDHGPVTLTPVPLDPTAAPGSGSPLPRPWRAVTWRSSRSQPVQPAAWPRR